MSTFFSKLLTRMTRERPAAPVLSDGERHERDGFALRIRSMLALVGVPSDYDAEQFALRMGSGSVSWLGNRYDEYASAPEEDREGIVMHVAHGIVEASRPSPVAEALAEARAHLRPRVRQRAHLVILGLQMEAEGLDPDGLQHAFVPVSEDLGAELVYDTPANIVSIPGERLLGWGLTPSQAMAIAVENLRLSARHPFRAVGDGAWASSVGDCYDSARVLLVDEIRSLPVDGRTIALPANRDTLLITGDESVGGLYRLLEVALQAIDKPRMDTLQPLVLGEHGWSDWTPEADHPMFDAFYELAVRTRGTSYAELKQLEERRHERDGADLFVASYGVFRTTDGAMSSSHAVWPPVRGWLPEADLISVLHPDDGRYIVVPMRHVLGLAAHLLAPVPDLHPPYRSFEGVPDERLWQALREHAVREGQMAR